MQIGMFDGAKLFINNKPIRLIELFGGIGYQAKALENLNIEFEHYRMCDFDKYAVQSYNAVHGTNFVPSDITKITAEDLGIVETDNYDYIMTYSFPCQSLSLAGKGEGMAKGGGTRSGLLWEVERLLNGMAELPQVLLMENVPQVHGKKNIDNFNEWCEFLESKGYKNYWQDLNAKNYGIPQNRKRTFMVSILGDYLYEFPKPFELKLRLKDMLEENVDEKFYLSEKMIKYAMSSGTKDFYVKPEIDLEIARPITTKQDKRAGTTNYISDKLIQVAQLDGFESSGRVYSEDGLAPTINTMGGGQREPKIAELIPFGSYYTWKDNQGNINTQCNRACDPENISLIIPTIAGHTKVVEKNIKGIIVIDGVYYRIRKLTPKECWRLMGLSDTDFDKAKASGISNSQLYKQAGNGIVVNVLMAIFKNLNLKGETE